MTLGLVKMVIKLVLRNGVLEASFRHFFWHDKCTKTYLTTIDIHTYRLIVSTTYGHQLYLLLFTHERYITG